MTLISRLIATLLGATPATAACSPPPAAPHQAETFTASDERRLARIAADGIFTGDARAGMWASMGAAVNGLTLADVKLLKEDRRRAAAAYPGVDQRELFEGRWFGFRPLSVPADAVDAYNAENTQGPDKVWYVDSAYLAVVRPQYPKRASYSEAVAYFARKKIADQAAELARLRTDGAMSWSGGSGGSRSIRCKPGGECVVEIAAEWSAEATRYTFPFVPEEWVGGFMPWEEADLRKLASFHGAKVEKVKVTPSGVRMTMGTGSSQGPKGVTIAPGGSVSVDLGSR